MIPNASVPNVRWSARRTRRNIILLGLAALLVVPLLGAVFTLDRLRIANRARLQRIYLAQAQQAQLFGLLRDMETGERAYLPTGNDVFLQPYNQAVQAYPSLAATLRDTIRSTNLQGVDADLAALEAAAAAWRAQSDQTLAQRAVAPLDAQTLQSALIEGKRLFDEVRGRDATLTTSLEGQRRALSVLPAVNTSNTNDVL